MKKIYSVILGVLLILPMTTPSFSGPFYIWFVRLPKHEAIGVWRDIDVGQEILFVGRPDAFQFFLPRSGLAVWGVDGPVPLTAAFEVSPRIDGITWETAPYLYVYGTWTATLEFPDPVNDPFDCWYTYWINWNDGTYAWWIGPYASGEIVKVSHSWSKEGSYTIWSKVKDVHDAEGAFTSLEITVSKSKMTYYKSKRIRYQTGFTG